MADLKRYRVTGEVTISVQTIVMARSEKHARKVAGEASMQQFCNGCASDPDHEDPEWRTTGELDGTAKIVEVEEEDEDDA